MRVLILSCNTGEGHNSCAKAIEEYYDTVGVDCVIEDSLRFISKSISKLISGGHVWIYRHAPGLFKLGYRRAEEHPVTISEDSRVNRLLAESVERLYQFISENEFDTVICTHVFSASMLTSVRKNYPLRAASCFVATDYTCSPGVKETELDCYFIPTGDLSADFVCPNIPEDKLVPCGIPVRQMFYRQRSSAQAKVQVHIPADHKHLLMMCGSMGCGPIEQMTGELSARLKDGWHLTIVCGTNEKLKKKLLQKYGDIPNLHIEGYVSDMSTLMDSADLYLTKPGGISVSEAAVKCLPMVFIDAVAGCEEYNRCYFTEKGGARNGSTVEKLTDICVELMGNDAARLAMGESLRHMARNNAAKMIFEHMNRLVVELHGQNREKAYSLTGS